MNPQDLIDLKNQMESLDKTVSGIVKDVTSMKLDARKYVESNITQTIPGIKCKIAYNKEGLVIEGWDLEVEDIPNLPIDKIIDLRRLLNQRLGTDEIQKMIKEAGGLPTVRRNITPGTGTKINYDETGLIVSSADLLPSDIPSLPIDKIETLAERLKVLESLDLIGNSVDKEEITPIAPGTFPKISYDNTGRVIGGSELSLDDIPQDILNRIDTLSKSISSSASRETVDNILEMLKGKLGSNPPIEEGTFTKVTVAKDGLVTNGGLLTIQDLPEINISNIPGLETQLKDKVSNENFVTLSNEVSKLESEVIKEAEIHRMSVATKAEEKDLVEVRSTLSSVEALVKSISENLPSEHLSRDITAIRNSLETLTGRVTVLEQRMDMKSHFSTEEEG